MTVDEIRKQVRAAPFRPFAIVMADGRAIPVHGPDWIFFPPAGHRIVIVADRDGGVDHIDTMHSTGLRFDPLPERAAGG